jgi:hypothetical protein
MIDDSVVTIFVPSSTEAHFTFAAHSLRCIDPMSLRYKKKGAHRRETYFMVCGSALERKRSIVVVTRV